MKTPESSSTPVYLQIKESVIQNIMNNVWTPGTQIPSEAALCQQFNVSRMTVNKALRELANEGLVTRHQGAGTYVAHPKYLTTLVKIPNIVKEIQDRGHAHSVQVLAQEVHHLSTQQAQELKLEGPVDLFYSCILHLDAGKPIQLEERYVNPKVFPSYLEQNWQDMTPHEYLMHEAPIPTGEYIIELRSPSTQAAKALKIHANEPCLVLSRWACVNQEYASSCVLWHPGHSYKFKGIF
ncbi:MAG: GntR family transcriptional regulator [Pelistega sp.]|nr:GntR family transcriptional regulator [Pelistega sp.]